MTKKKVGIIGATGYTGSELVYILTNHPNVSLEIITSESKSGEKFSDIHPQFRSINDQELVPMESISDHPLDMVFLGLPHGVSMDFIKNYGYKDYKVIDLSGDFRLSSAGVYNQWYPKEHVYEAGFEDAVYGLPELFRNKIEQAQLVANPGCYPTSVILPLAPLLKNDLVEPSNIVADSKSGVTGAGAKVRQKTHFPNVNDNFSAYGLKSHRHTPEMQEALSNFTGHEVELLFTPHLLPVNRGILSTIYAKPKKSVSDKALKDAFHALYEDEPFVRILDHPPVLQNVRGSNYCDIYATFDDRTNKILVLACIDNLMKGAASQAVQNMNLLFGWKETTGLTIPPLQP